MKKVSLKINHQQLVDLSQWMEWVLVVNRIRSPSFQEKCFLAVFAMVRINKGLPKTYYKFPGYTRIILQAHEAFALAEAISGYSAAKFPYIDAWLSANLLLLDQKFT